MAALVNSSKSVLGSFAPTIVVLATSGDTLPYTAGSGQELSLFNTDVSPIVVTIDGADGTTVPVIGAGAATFSVAAGYTITVAAGASKVVRLDTIPFYLAGVVAISAVTGAKVAAWITQ